MPHCHDRDVVGADVVIVVNCSVAISRAVCLLGFIHIARDLPQTQPIFLVVAQLAALQPVAYACWMMARSSDVEVRRESLS